MHRLLSPSLRLTGLAAVLAVAGCPPPRTLSEEDCAQAKKAILRAWAADANAAVNAAERSDFRRFVKSEGDRIGEEWSRRCKAMVGRPIEQQELACLNQARRIDDVYACLPTKSR